MCYFSCKAQKNTISHFVKKIKGFPLKVKSFRNTATYQKLRGGVPSTPPSCTTVGVWLCVYVRELRIFFSNIHRIFVWNCYQPSGWNIAHLCYYSSAPLHLPNNFFQQSKLSINKLRLAKMANTLNRGGMGDITIDLPISTNFVYLLSTEKMLGEAIAVRSSGLTIFW